MLNILALSLALLTSNHQSLGRHKYVQTTYKAKFVLTQYAPGEPGIGKYTYSGEPVKKGVVAVDPRVIPLYSHVYIPDYGWFIALDTGGKVKGRHIDIYVTSRHQANRFGRRKCIVGVYPRSKDKITLPPAYVFYLKLHHVNAYNEYIKQFK